MSILDAKLVHQISTAAAETTALLSTDFTRRDDPDWVTRAGHLLEKWQGVGDPLLAHAAAEQDDPERTDEPDIRAEDMTPELHYRAASQCLQDANTVADGSKTQRAYLKFAEVHAMLAGIQPPVPSSPRLGMLSISMPREYGPLFKPVRTVTTQPGINRFEAVRGSIRAVSHVIDSIPQSEIWARSFHQGEIHGVQLVRSTSGESPTVLAETAEWPPHLGTS